MVRAHTRGRAAAGLLVAFLAAGCGKSPGQEAGDGDGGVESDASLDDAAIPPRDTGPQLWANLGANAQRTSRTHALGPRQGTVRSVRLADAGWVTVEAIGPTGRVYVWVGAPDGPGQVLALDADGEVLWRYPRETAGASRLACPGAALTGDGTLLAAGFLSDPSPTPDASEAAVVFGLDPDGDPGWRFRAASAGDAPGTVSHAALVFDDTGAFYAVLGPGQNDVAATGRYLYAFEPDGALRWVWPREVGSASVPLALTPYGDVRVVRSTGADPPGQDEGLYALDPLTGAEQWFYEVGYTQVRHLSVNDVGRTYVTGLAHADPAVIIIDAFGEMYGENGFSPRHYDYFTTPVASRISASWCFGLSMYEGYDDPEPGGRVFCWAKGEFDFAELKTVGDPCGALAVDGEDVIFAVTVGNGAPTRVIAMEMGEMEGTELFSVDLPTDDPSHECTADGVRDLVYAPAIGDGRLYVGSPDGRLHIVQ